MGGAFIFSYMVLLYLTGSSSETVAGFMTSMCFSNKRGLLSNKKTFKKKHVPIKYSEVHELYICHILFFTYAELLLVQMKQIAKEIKYLQKM